MLAIPEKASPLQDSVPLVSIGVPVYNGRATLQRVLDSLLAQSLADFEIIISDNGSTDGTSTLCGGYAEKDNRVRYLRQKENIGVAPNFKFVLEQARGKYFLWAASDDVRSPDFLEENVRFLEGHPAYVASTSPNCFEGQDPTGADLVSFSIAADSVQERFSRFFEHCWKSHGIFYSVVRTAVLRECDIVGQSFIAADWGIDLFLASRGKIHRSDKGLTMFGLNGISSRPGAYRAFRNQPIELLLPFYRLSRYVLGLSVHFPFGARLSILMTLLKLNMSALWDQSYSALYQFYCAHLKPKRKLTNLE